MTTKFVYKDSSAPWWGLLGGCMLTAGSLFALLTIDDGTMFRGVYVPIWVEWLLLPVGIGLTAFSIYELIRDKSKPITNTDEDFAEAEAEMDALYLREYGELPKKPKPEIIESKTIEPEIAEPVKPQKGTE